MIYLLVNFLFVFFPLIILKSCIFKVSVLFGPLTLLDKSIIVLQHPTHPTNLTTNG